MLTNLIWNSLRCHCILVQIILFRLIFVYNGDRKCMHTCINNKPDWFSQLSCKIYIEILCNIYNRTAPGKYWPSWLLCQNWQCCILEFQIVIMSTDADEGSHHVRYSVRFEKIDQILNLCELVFTWYVHNNNGDNLIFDVFPPNISGQAQVEKW